MVPGKFTLQAQKVTGLHLLVSFFLVQSITIGVTNEYCRVFVQKTAFTHHKMHVTAHCHTSSVRGGINCCEDNNNIYAVLYSGYKYYCTMNAFFQTNSTRLSLVWGEKGVCKNEICYLTEELQWAELMWPAECLRQHLKKNTCNRCVILVISRFHSMLCIQMHTQTHQNLHSDGIKKKHLNSPLTHYHFREWYSVDLLNPVS